MKDHLAIVNDFNIKFDASLKEFYIRGFVFYKNLWIMVNGTSSARMPKDDLRFSYNKHDIDEDLSESDRKTIYIEVLKEILRQESHNEVEYI